MIAVDGCQTCVAPIEEVDVEVKEIMRASYQHDLRGFRRLVADFSKLGRNPRGRP